MRLRPSRGSATVTCHTIVRGYGRVEGSALLRHYTRVGDHAVVKGRCNISGAVYLGGRTVVTGDAILVGGALFNSSAPVTIDRTPPTAMRSDGYQFVLVPYGEDKTLHVFAGCRRFTIAEARRHWRATRGGTPLGDESLAIVAHLARMAKIVWPEFET